MKSLGLVLLLIGVTAFSQGRFHPLSAKSDGSFLGTLSSQATEGFNSIASPGISLALNSFMLSTLSKDGETFGCHHPQSGPLPSWECGHSPSTILVLSGPFSVALLSLHPDNLPPSKDRRSFDRPLIMLKAPFDTPDRPPTIFRS